MSKLTALVITYNECIHIDDLINNIDFADEIIFVDSFSNDGTFEKLKSYNHITTYQSQFKNFPDQKNFALHKASHDWVLFIDADERIPLKLKQEILDVLKKPSENISAYYCKFQYFFGKKPIKFSGFQTAKSFRLFKTSKCRYDDSRPVHERLIVDGSAVTLQHKILHYSFRDYEHYKSKMAQYATLKAEQLHKKGETVSFFKSKVKPLYRFFNHYIIRLGILDGKIGYDISKLNAFEVSHRYKELQRLNSLSGTPEK